MRSPAIKRGKVGSESDRDRDRVTGEQAIRRRSVPFAQPMSSNSVIKTIFKCSTSSERRGRQGLL